MGCANCKKATDATSPTQLPPMIIANSKFLQKHKDLASLKKEIEKHGPEYLNMFMEDE